MITIKKQINIDDFEGWDGGEVTLQKIRKAGKLNDLEDYINNLFEDGCSETELNDELRFNDDTIFEAIDMPIDDDEMWWPLTFDKSL